MLQSIFFLRLYTAFRGQHEFCLRPKYLTGPVRQYFPIFLAPPIRYSSFLLQTVTVDWDNVLEGSTQGFKGQISYQNFRQFTVKRKFKKYDKTIVASLYYYRANKHRDRYITYIPWHVYAEYRRASLLVPKRFWVCLRCPIRRKHDAG